MVSTIMIDEINILFTLPYSKMYYTLLFQQWNAINSQIIFHILFENISAYFSISFFRVAKIHECITLINGDRLYYKYCICCQVKLHAKQNIASRSSVILLVVQTCAFCIILRSLCTLWTRRANKLMCTSCCCITIWLCIGN